MPEFFNGKNVADFIDPDIAEKLEALEREEEALEAQGFYASDDEEELDTDEENFIAAANQVRERKAQMKLASQSKNRLQNKAPIPRKKRHLTLSELTDGMREAGVDPSVIEKRAKRLMEKKKAEWEAAEAADAERAAAAGADEDEGMGSDGGMDVDSDDNEGEGEEVTTSRKGRNGKAITLPGSSRGPKNNRQLAGLATRQQDNKAVELRHFAQRERNRLAKASESDRHVPITRPKWMLSGKRKQGTNSRR
jgi:nucleolar GTP-binding protein